MEGEDMEKTIKALFVPNVKNSARIRAFRALLGLSQKEAAERVGLNQPTWSRIESGKRGVTPEEQEQIAAALAVEIETIGDRVRENFDTGLTEGEQRVSDHLVGAFNEFSKLDRTHPSEMDEFVSALHRLQDLLAVRIVRRQFPKGWPTYREEEKSK